MTLPKLGRLSARLAVCLLAFAAGLSCFLLWQYNRTAAAPENAEQTAAAQPPRPAVTEPAPAEVERGPRGPIGKIDFQNFTYPSPSAGRRVTVRDGELEYPTEPGCGQSFSVEEVQYIDFTGDGEDEALVRFHDHQACGSSFVSVNYFVYTVRKGRPRLLWSFATGSEAYGGRKDFRVEGNELVFELYGIWRVSGDGIKFVTSIKVEEEQGGPPFFGDRFTRHYSIYRVAWDGRKFRRKSLEDVRCPDWCQVN